VFVSFSPTLAFLNDSLILVILASLLLLAISFVIPKILLYKEILIKNAIALGRMIKSMMKMMRLGGISFSRSKLVSLFIRAGKKGYEKV
jgi:CBS domain containing-hemolysin-like protein